jgi:transposase
MPRYKQPRRTWAYTEDFKSQAVLMSDLPGVLVKDVAKVLDIHPFMLSRWRKEFREGKIVPDRRKKLNGAGMAVHDLSRLDQLERENAQLKKENDLLKKWQRFLAEEHQRGIDSSRETDTTE